MLTTLVILALVLWIVFSYLIPKLPDPLNTIASVVVAILAIVYLLHLVGIGV